MGLFETGIDTFISLMFLITFGVIAYVILSGLRQWKKNNDSPVLSVAAAVVTKRTNVEHFHSDGGQGGVSSSSASTTYYVTFEVESGDRLEFRVKSKEYGLLAENDTGILTFQGTRYHGFVRNRN